jgi:hypothetical protein
MGWAKFAGNRKSRTDLRKDDLSFLNSLDKRIIYHRASVCRIEVSLPSDSDGGDANTLTIQFQ